jgi:hypothetical protein
MLNPKNMSIERFFDRDDKETEILLEQIKKAPDSGKAMKTSGNALKKSTAVKIMKNSPEAVFSHILL